MKIAILGAGGGTGLRVVDTALRRGHEVTAVVRRPGAVPDADRPGLSVALADVRDAGSLPGVIVGHDAVVSAIGVARGKPHGLYSEGTASIVDAMAGTGVSRLVAVSSGGVNATDPGLPWWYRRLLIPFVLRDLYADMDLMESTVRASGLDWTLVRASYLNDHAPTGDVAVLDGHQPPGRWKLSRADLAEFLVEEVESGRWLHRVPTLAQ